MFNVGDKIKQLRIKNGLTLREIDDRINISFTHLSRIERGDKTPNLELLYLLSNHFDVPMTYFFEDETNITNENETNKWVVFGEKVESEYNLTPEEIENMLNVFSKLLK